MPGDTNARLVQLEVLMSWASNRVTLTCASDRSHSMQTPVVHSYSHNMQTFKVTCILWWLFAPLLVLVPIFWSVNVLLMLYKKWELQGEWEALKCKPRPLFFLALDAWSTSLFSVRLQFQALMLSLGSLSSWEGQEATVVGISMLRGEGGETHSFWCRWSKLR